MYAGYTPGPGVLMVWYGWYVKFLLCCTVFSCTLEVQEVRSVELFTIKFHHLPTYFALLGKIDI